MKLLLLLFIQQVYFLYWHSLINLYEIFIIIVVVHSTGVFPLLTFLDKSVWNFYYNSCCSFNRCISQILQQPNDDEPAVVVREVHEDIHVPVAPEEAHEVARRVAALRVQGVRHGLQEPERAELALEEPQRRPASQVWHLRREVQVPLRPAVARHEPPRRRGLPLRGESRNAKETVYLTTHSTRINHIWF